MLDTLKTIDWSQIGSCYGRSNKIPKAIRGLTSKDATARERALGTLWNNLTHQGSVYEASALAVPFLLEIVVHPQAQDKCQVVNLLACLGSKGAYLRPGFETLERRLLLQYIRDEPLPHPEAVYDYRRWTEQTQQAVRNGLPLFLPLLADPDPAMRMEIAFLLSAFQQDRSWLSPPVIRQLQEETNEYVQCCLLLCLGQLLLPTPEASALLMRYLVEGETELLQFTAAMALCTLLEEKTPEEVVQCLFRVLVDPLPLQPSYEQIPREWGSCWVHMRALYYLDLLTASPHQTCILERLVEVLPILDDRIDQDAADLLLRVVFFERGFRLRPPMTFADLDPLQQQILRRIADTETLWRSPWATLIQRKRASSSEEESSFERQFNESMLKATPDFSKALTYVGLPTTHQSLQTFIATTSR